MQLLPQRMPKILPCILQPSHDESMEILYPCKEKRAMTVSFSAHHVNNETTKKTPMSTYQFLSSALISSSLEIRSLSLSRDLTLRQNLFKEFSDKNMSCGVS